MKRFERTSKNTLFHTTGVSSVATDVSSSSTPHCQLLHNKTKTTHRSGPEIQDQTTGGAWPMQRTLQPFFIPVALSYKTQHTHIARKCFLMVLVSYPSRPFIVSSSFPTQQHNFIRASTNTKRPPLPFCDPKPRTAYHTITGRAFLLKPTCGYCPLKRP